MRRLIRQFILVAGASTLGAAAPGNVHAQGVNALEIVIGNGPQAGTYKLPATNTICLRTTQPNPSYQERYIPLTTDACEAQGSVIRPQVPEGRHLHAMLGFPAALFLDAGVVKLADALQEETPQEIARRFTSSNRPDPI